MMKRFTAALAIVSVAIVGFVALSPASGQDRTEERLSALETRVAVLEQRVKIDAIGGTDAASSETPAATYTLTGEITLYGRDHSRYVTAPACVGVGGYDDLRPGTGVTVRNQDGTIIATGALAGGVAPPTARSHCTFSFTVSDVPYSPFYSVEVSHRGELAYSFEELEEMGWHVALALGD
jgi:hypothetical protein